MKRRITIVALFWLAWTALSSVQVAHTPLQGGVALSTFALGLLIALVSGDLVSRLGLPRISGYVAAGITLGPITGLFGGALLWDLVALQEAALALLAFGAGAQLNLKNDMRLARTSLGTGLLSALVTVVFVLGITLGLAPLHALFTGTSTFTLKTSLVLALLMVSTSPSIVGWVLSQTRRAGAVATLGLSTTLIRCLLVVFALGLVALGEGDAGEHSAATLWATPLCAFLLAAVVRFIAPRLTQNGTLVLWVLLSLCTGTIEALGADAILTLALAGVMTRHWTPSERRGYLDAGVTDLMLPAALVLFTLLGATFALPTLGALPLIATLFVGRGAAIWLSTRLAAQWSHAPEAFQRSGWLLLIPQGSFALGVIASLSTFLPDTIEAIRQSVEAIVALSVLVGPLAARIALRQAGEHEAPTEQDVTPPAFTPPLDLSSEPEHPWRDPMAALAGPDDPTPRAAWAANVQAMVLLRSRVREHVVGERLERLAKAHKTAATLARQILQNAGEALGRSDTPEERLKLLNDARTSLAEGVALELQPLLDQLTTPSESSVGLIEALTEELSPIVRSAPTLLEARENDRHIRWAADDTRWIRLGKLLKRPLRRLQAFLGRPAPLREIPYRRLVRRALSGEMLASLGKIEAIVSRAEYKALRRLENHLTDANGVLVEAAQRDDDPMALKEWMQTRVAQLRDASKDGQSDIRYLVEEPLHRISEAMAQGLNRLAYMSDIAGTFALTEGHIRYASVAPSVRAAMHQSEQDRAAWNLRKQAQLERTLLGLQLVELEVGLRHLVMGEALGPAVRMHRRVQDLMTRAHELVVGVRDEIASSTTPPHAEDEARAAEQLLNDLQRRVARPLEGLINGLRSGGIIDRLISALETATAPLPEHIALLPEQAIVVLERGAVGIETPSTVAVRERARAFFDRRVAVSLAEHSRALETSAEEARAGIRDAQRLLSVHIARANAATQREDHEAGGESDEGIHRLTLAALNTVIERLDVEIAQSAGTSEALLEEIAKTKAEAVRDLWTHLHNEALRPQLEQAVWGLWRVARQWFDQLAHHRYVTRTRALTEAFQRRLRLTQDIVEARNDMRLTGPTRVREALRQLEPGQGNMPYVYGKLFALTPTENDAFLLGRDRELQLLRSRAEGQGSGALIVIGDRGQGRSSLVRVALAQSGAKRDLVWLDTERALDGAKEVIEWAAHALGMRDAVPTMEGVCTELRQRGALVVLDDLESLIPRSRKGLEALEALMALIVATERHALWMVTCERHIWRLLSTLCPMADAFDVTVNLDALSTEEIREAIERRHRLSGLEPHYARPKSSDLSAWLSHILGASPAERTFRKLTERTHGNPRSAMHLWQLSLTQRSESERAVDIALASPLVLRELRTLPSHLTPAIALVYRQVSVDRRALEVALGWSGTQVSAAIHALELAGLLSARSRADGESTWSLVPHACAPIQRFLIREGLLPRYGRSA